MDEDIRRSKIEAGKQTLKNFMKKRNKKVSKGGKNTLDLPVSQDTNCNAGNIGNCEETASSSVLEQNADLLYLSGQKLQKYQEMLQAREDLINKLTSQLHMTLEAQKTAQSESVVHAEALAQEVNVLRLQLQEAADTLENHKKFNGMSAQEYFDFRNQLLIAEENNVEKTRMIEQLMKELSDYKSREEDFNAISDLLKSESYLLKDKRIQELNTKNEQLTEKLQHAESDLTRSDAEIADLHNNVERLEKKTVDLQKEMEIIQLEIHNIRKDELSEKEHKSSISGDIEHSSVRGHLAGEQLSSTDMQSWQVQAAQTNSRLLHVLSDLVKINLDIERDINTRLMEFGFMSRNSETLHHDDDTGQSVGSREDCTGISIGESPNLDLTEDGPDLTPRAWDLFTSVAMYDSEIEGEDVVIGASRRLRNAVNHVLNLLSLAFDKANHSDYKTLLKRNEDLTNDLHAEYEDKDNLQLDLVHAESIIRKQDAAKQKLEDDNYHLTEMKEILSQEVEVLKSKIMNLEEQKEITLEEKKCLEEQCQLLSSRLGDPERKLLQENTKLSSERQRIQMHLNKERHNLSSRVQQLEMALEEMSAEKDEIIEKNQREIKDLNSQIESIEKQLQSSKKFIDEQVLERDSEREEHYREIRKLKEALREKDKSHSLGQQLTKETECLERQLKDRIEAHKAVVFKKGELEKELLHTLDKVNDLRDVIRELEKQLEVKTKNEEDLKEKLETLSQSFSELEKSNSELKNQLNEFHACQTSQVSIEQLHDLQEQLASKSQDITLLSQSDSLLHELRGQIHFLEAKVDQQIRQLEAMHLVSLAASPVPSEDTSQSEYHDGDVHSISCNDGWEMSPRSVHWLEIHRLEEKIGRLVQIEEELVKHNKDLNAVLKKMKVADDEQYLERKALQEKVTEQLLEISALKSHIEEQKHKMPPSKKLQHQLELENLTKTLKLEQEKANQALVMNHELQDKLLQAENEIRDHRESLRKLLIKNQHAASLNGISQETQTEFVDSFKDHKQKEIISSELKNAQARILDMEQMLSVSNKQLETEKINCEALIEEVAELAQAKDASKIKHDEMSSQMQALCSENQKLKENLVKLEEQLSKSKEEIAALVDCLEKSKLTSMTMTKELETHQTQFEKDFNTIQDMMEKKEKELAILHEETENQLRLEAEVDQLNKVVNILQADLEQARNSYANDSEMWKLKNAELTKKLKLEQEHLNNQISVLKSNLTYDYENADVLRIQHSIVDAAGTLHVVDESSKQFFKEVVYHILKQFMDFKLNQLQETHIKQIECIKASWPKELAEQRLKAKQDAEKLYNEKILLLQKQHEEEIQNFSLFLKEKFNEKIKALEHKIKDLEEKEGKNESLQKHTAQNVDLLVEKYKNDIKHLKSDKEHVKVSLSEEFFEKTKALQEANALKIAELNSVIEKLFEEKEILLRNIKKLNSEKEEQKTLHEAEKAILIKECENKFTCINEKLKKEFDKEKKIIEDACDKKIHALKESILANSAEKRSILTAQYKKQLDKLRSLSDGEIEKICLSHKEEINEVKTPDALCDACDRLTDAHNHKLRSMQNECEAKIENEKAVLKLHFQEEIRAIKIKLDNEKEDIIKLKENVLREEFDHAVTKMHEDLTATVINMEKKFASEKAELKLIYEKKIDEIKRRYLAKLKTQKNEINRLEERHQLMLKGGRSSSAKISTLLETSASDVNLSSDDTCSSCHEDLMGGNQSGLIRKIHQEGCHLLSLTKHQKENIPGFRGCCLLEQSLQEKEKILLELIRLLNQINEPLNVKTVICDIAFATQNALDSIYSAAVMYNKQVLRLELELNALFVDLNKLTMKEDLRACIEELKLKLDKRLSSPNIMENLESKKASQYNSRGSSFFTPSAIEKMRSAMPVKSFENSFCTISTIEHTPCATHYDDNDSLQKFLDEKPLIEPKYAKEVPNLLEKESFSSPNSSFSQPVLENHPIMSPEAISESANDILKEEKHLNKSNEWKMSLLKVFTPSPQLKTDLEISGQDVNTNKINNTAVKLHHLYWKYKRANSHLKAIIYQKKYLMSLLSGYQATEEIMLTIFKDMGVSVSKQKDFPSLSKHGKPRGCSLFRSAAFVIIAIKRMKFILIRWRNAAIVPPIAVVEKEINPAVGLLPRKSSVLTIGSKMSLNSSLSTPTSSLSVEDVGTNRDRSFLRKALQTSSEEGADLEPGRLMQYVCRLEHLHKKLGLRDLDNS